MELDLGSFVLLFSMSFMRRPFITLSRSNGKELELFTREDEEGGAQ